MDTLGTNNILAQPDYGLQGGGAESGTKVVTQIRMFPGNADFPVLFFQVMDLFNTQNIPRNDFCGDTKLRRKDPGRIHDHNFSKSSARAFQEITTPGKERERGEGQPAAADRGTSSRVGVSTEPVFVTQPWNWRTETWSPGDFFFRDHASLGGCS